MERPDYLKYKVSSKLPRLLGRESVSTEVQALFELVKNAYDADAPRVTLVFKHIELFHEANKKLQERYKILFTKLKSEKSLETPLSEIDDIVKNDPHYIAQYDLVEKYAKMTSITVEDNGKGMTLDELQNKWMKIGVSKENSEYMTDENRRVVGEKGVGRFAVERLSRSTKITSKTKGSKHAIITETDWDQFEESTKNVTDIKIPIHYEPKSENEKGLKIELTGLRDRWTVQKIERLLEELSLLVLPEEIDPNFPFSIKAKYEKKGKFQEIEVESGLFKKSPYHFIAELTSESKIRFSKITYKKESIIPNTRGVTYENLNEEFPFVRKGEKESSVARCGPVKLTYYGFPFDPTGKSFGWTEFYGKDRLLTIRSDVKDNSGIRLYRDGFRVRPYGEQGNDWLSLESEARSTSGKLANESVIGWVTISTDQNPDIVDTTTREKIIENESFDDLVSFVQRALHEFYRFTEGRRKALVKKQAITDVPKFVRKLRDQINTNSSLSNVDRLTMLANLDNIQSQLVDEEKHIDLEKETLMDEKNAFRNLASLGIATGVISHEVRDYLRVIFLHTGLLKRENEKGRFDKDKLTKSLEYITPSVENLKNYMAMVSAFTSSMSSRKKEFRKKLDLNLYNEVDFLGRSLSGIMGRWEINFENNVPKDFPKLRMYKADLQSILLNFVSNSIKSLKLLYGDRKDLSNSQKNKIQISVKETKSSLEILFSDNGIGIAQIDRDYIFDLFWTRTAEKESVKTGSGLGLPIIKSIMGDYQGTVTAEDRSQFASGVTFKLSFPKDHIIRNA